MRENPDCSGARRRRISARALFEPLGWEITTQAHALDEAFPAWGTSRYHSVELRGEKKLCDLLAHLYVLLPVLDDEKHYWVGDDEVEQLLRRGEGWLGNHPQREAIVQRYLRRRRTLTRAAFEQLTRDEEPETDESDDEEKIERPISLHEQRLNAVLEELKNSGAQRVLDLGCGEGRLLQLLMKDRQFQEILGADVSHRALEIAADRLHLETMAPSQKARLKLMQGALTYRDARLENYDAAAVVEVIEHLDAARLASFERVLWEFARPNTIVLTTPNSEYNIKWPTLAAGKFRHRDHRFEWSRAEFESWARGVAQRSSYNVRFAPIGESDETVGAPSQMAVFTKVESSE